MGIRTTVTCDVCGREVTDGTGARIDFAAHNRVKVMLASFPPIDPSVVDLCKDCTEQVNKMLDFLKEAVRDERQAPDEA